MTGNLFENASLDNAIASLKNDLLDATGPKISTMRNYRFAILHYDPRQEFKLRDRIRRLTDDLKSQGWNVLLISLHRLLLDRLKREEPRILDSLIRTEQRLYNKDSDRALNHLRDKIAQYIEGTDGIAQDVITLINEFTNQHPEQADRTLIFLGRAGSLYPFFRSSALLKHIDGKTNNLPVVLLYPGERRDLNALSFMGELPSDRDYRPRIYS
ncbi:DUF1788 domain-containing protein [Nostoc punctiforme FACHB-252]|uniref:DUF1788 domain-containing protein n=1 Tax=Nostoc punctiforme FACHB-252 TaxID=1357509 RepID=A0ABR8HFI8_NOSPU|nr:BREX protein BrxB domain-containing protein [Nostoc punctiforme]MBD2613873.1 DUF1788 domain-containing protein [Nostoc punctiforme FACHB-252]